MAKYFFFYKIKSPFSQWYKSNFKVDEITFNCAEQYMMYKKAMLFDDVETANKILKTKNQREQKQLGRMVRNFNQAVWDKNCKDIVYKANWEKFTQNKELKKILLETKGTILVEASPNDTIWGIGLSIENPDRFDKSKWKGKNWLGEILTDVREKLDKDKDKG
jgi:ribA/ribD-fused uncharacterized protein